MKILLNNITSLSPYPFAMIMDVLALENDLSPWCMLYANDILLCGTRSEVGRVENGYGRQRAEYQ